MSSNLIFTATFKKALQINDLRGFLFSGCTAQSAMLFDCPVTLQAE